MRVFLLAAALIMGACQAQPQPEPTPRPMRSAVQAQPSVACRVTSVPVPTWCLPPTGSPDRCPTEDGNDGAGRPCWWKDPQDGRVWYRP